MTNESEVCVVKCDGIGTLQEQAARINKTFTSQGWEFLELVRPWNDYPTMFFRRRIV